MKMAAENAYKYDYGYGNSTAAQPLEKERKKRQSQQKQNVSKVQQSEKAQRRAATLQLARAAGVLAIALTMFAVGLNSFVVRDRAKNRFETANDSLVICQAEYKELNAKLTALKSVENIDKYAVEKLGLVKVTPENEIYLNSTSGNRVVLSADSD